MVESVDKQERNNTAEKTYENKVELIDIWKVLNHREGIIRSLSNYAN